MQPNDLEDDELWHPSGWSPVYDGLPTTTRLVGFTNLQTPVRRFLISRPGATEDPDGAFVINGEARRLLGRHFYCWVVETGDYGDMPGFWPL